MTKSIFREKQSSGTEIYHFIEIFGNPFKYKMVNSILIVSICMGYSIRMKRVNKKKMVKNKFYFLPVSPSNIALCLFIFDLSFYIPVNSYGHAETVSSPSHTFSWASLTKQLTSTLCTYFCLYMTTTLLESAGGE